MIRKYNSNDKVALLNLLALNTPQFFADSEAIDFEEYLNSKIQLYYVLELENQILGCGGINFDQNNSTASISWDIIHPEYHGKSFGSQLLNYRMEQIEKISNIQKIIVRTSQLTYPFYEKHGFTTVEIHQDYWSKGFDMYLMIFQKKE